MTDTAGELSAQEVAHELRSRLAEKERLLQLTAAADAVLTSAGDYERALQRLAGLVVPELADLCLIDIADSTGRLRKVAAAYDGPAPRALVHELVRRYPPLEGSPHPAVRAVETGTVSWVTEMGDELLRQIARDERHFEILKALGARSYLSVPIVAGADVLGALTLVGASSGRRFGEGDFEVPRLLASQAAVALRWALQRDREHELASALQARLLPSELPPLEGVSVAARYVAGAGGEVGGDFYDIGVLPSGRVGFMVGDVAGHDAPAAVVMGQLRAATRALAGQVHEPAALVDLLQWSWPFLGFDRMATAVFARLNVATRVVAVASAGHVPPLVCDSAGPRFMELPTAPPLGVPGPPAEDHEETLRAWLTGRAVHRRPRREPQPAHRDRDEAPCANGWKDRAHRARGRL